MKDVAPFMKYRPVSLLTVGSADSAGSGARRTHARLTVVAVGLALGLISACSDDGSVPPQGADPAESSQTSGPFDADATVESLQTFWADAAADAGVEEYETLEAERIQPLGGGPVVCESEEVADSEIEGNAVAFSCAEGLSVMWDPAMLSDLESKFGPAAPAMVIAHEWGHVIDYQAGHNFQGVIAEQFADCMAGVWVADQTSTGAAPFDNPGSLDATVSAAAEFRDEPGDDAGAEDAHGLAFDRIRAFQEGFDRGAAFCATYGDTPPALTETPFTGEEIETGGNMDFDEGFELVSDALVEFMGANPQPFETDAVALSYMTKDELADMHERLGDSATVVVLATDTAASVQSAGGEDPTEEGPLLQQACWTGAFLGWVSEGKSEIMSVSPGDLDEAVASFADLTDPASGGFLFEQVAQLRTGFTQGVQACVLPE